MAYHHIVSVRIGGRNGAYRSVISAASAASAALESEIYRTSERTGGGRKIGKK